MRRRFDEVASQRRYGTPAFGLSFMKKTIGIGTPLIGPKKELLGFDDTEKGSTISISAWLNFVPEEYRGDCISYARLALEKYRGEAMGAKLLAIVVTYLHESVWDALLPLPIKSLTTT